MSELQHYGIKGMRWGVRRFQNPDGTLTSAGKKRRNIYDINAEYYEKKAKKLDARAKRNSTMARLNKTASEKGTGLISKVNALNANYYQKKADKLASRAIRNRTMASLNSQASKRLGEERAARAYKKMSGESIRKASESKHTSSGKSVVQRLLDDD